MQGCGGGKESEDEWGALDRWSRDGSEGVLRGRKRVREAVARARAANDGRSSRGKQVCSERREDFTLGGRQCYEDRCRRSKQQQSQGQNESGILASERVTKNFQRMSSCRTGDAKQGSLASPMMAVKSLRHHFKTAERVKTSERHCECVQASKIEIVSRLLVLPPIGLPNLLDTSTMLDTPEKFDLSWRPSCDLRIQSLWTLAERWSGKSLCTRLSSPYRKHGLCLSVYVDKEMAAKKEHFSQVWLKLRKRIDLEIQRQLSTKFALGAHSLELKS